MFGLLALACLSDVGLISEHTNYVYPDLVVDTINQPEQIDSLDILVLLDKSCSMYDDALRVGAGMGKLATDIDSLTTNYQFGFLSMDPACTDFKGPFSSNQIIDITMAPSIVGPTCYGEAGFGAAYNYMSQTPFFRPETDLLIFMISDEEEQSGIDTTLIKTYFDSYKKDADIDYVSIVGVAIEEQAFSECGAFAHTKYEDLSNLYGYEAINICSDWDQWLSQSSILISLTREIKLSYLPVISSIEVYRENTLTTDWTYDDITNSIILIDPDYSETYSVGYYRA